VGRDSARSWLEALAGEEYCYLTTVGRRTGNPHTIEIWFAVLDGALYMMSGNRDRSDWVRNVKHNPGVTVRVGQETGDTREGHARVVNAQTEPDLDAAVRRALAAKYQGWREDRPLSTWARTALPVEVRFDAVS
jgi:deazaflavin-dependent oxidoreductase (nitroreductase family)